ncbi:hypothetical protein ACGFY9_16940 [Streptomyces sp. NPDC048504]|uniref:hypothetical protein n=1 Tax=Streptomyces sp. NPDC048504 TaxID=3365559 RepID=UPI003720D385
MARAADTGSRSENGGTRAPLRGRRSDRHLARVTALAVAALIATQWLPVVAGLTAG